MAETTKIEWCDATFNGWIGCTKVSSGCANCYAENQTFARAARANGRELWGAGQPRHRTSAAYWKQPLKWDREAGKLPAVDGTIEREWHRPRVFCSSLADWLDDEVPIEWLADLLDLIRRTPHLDWLLLTKRPQNWHERIRLARNHLTIPNGETALWLANWLPKKESAGMPARAGTPPANVWIGTTVEDQARADERIPALLKIPAPVRFLSMEPLLSGVELRLTHPTAEEWPVRHPDLTPYQDKHRDIYYRRGIHWVICGGESGPKARPMHPGWARSLRDQCAAAGVPFLFKQWGEWAGHEYPADGVVHVRADGSIGDFPLKDSWSMKRVGKHAAGRLLDGREHNEFPEVRS